MAKMIGCQLRCFRRHKEVALLLSLPDAIITKAYAPILILGAVGGLVIGLIVGRWGA